MLNDDLPDWVRQHRWELGARIRNLRLGCDLTQEQLAEKVDADRKTISRLENGHYDISVDFLVRVARALGVPSWRLFRDE